MENFKFSEYTQNMYLNKKSKFWTYFNILRINKIIELLKKHNNFNDIIEIGAFDLYFGTLVLNFLSIKNLKSYYFVDIYNDKYNNFDNHKNKVLEEMKESEFSSIYEIAKFNIKELKKNNSNIKFELISSFVENLDEKLNKSFDAVFIFETLEHVIDEEKTINNINNLIKENGYVFVSVPVEFGFMFLLKEIGRFLVLGKTNHSLKEIFFSTFGYLNKVKRVLGAHNGYDYRNTIKMFEKFSFKMIEKIYYPNRILKYGVIFVFQKIN